MKLYLTMDIKRQNNQIYDFYKTKSEKIEYLKPNRIGFGTKCSSQAVKHHAHWYCVYKSIQDKNKLLLK